MSTEKNQDGTESETGGEEAEVSVEDLQKQLKERDEAIGSLKRDLKKATKAMEDVKKSLEPKDTPEKTQQSNEPDYAKLAYLKANQVDHPDDQKIVLEEAARLKLPLTDVLNMEHIKTRLQSQQDDRTSQAAMPDGKGRKGGPNKGDVEYYLAHPDEIPEDLELHNKVIEAKMKTEKSRNQFSDVMFIG